MVSLLRSIFKMHPGEEQKTGMLFVLGFLWSLGASCGNILMDALYVAYVGSDHLPYIFLFTSMTMFVIAIIFLKALNNIRIYQIYRFMLLVTALFYLSAYLLLLNGIENYYYWSVLKVFSYIAFINLITCYWTFIDQYFGLQEAKRLFNIFNSAVFSGVAVSGALMSMSYFTPERLFFFIFCCLALSLIFIQVFSSKMKYIHYYEEEEESCSLSLKDLVVIILRSRFTLYLLLLNIFTQVLEIITEYQYMSEFENIFLTQYGIEDFHRPLTHFIGKVTAGVSVVNILFGFIIYSRLIVKIGIKNLAFIVPVMFLALYTGWIKFNYLFFPVFGYAIVEGFLYTVADNNFALLLNGAPQKAKNKIRVVFESFFEPIGMLTSSVFLIFAREYAKEAGLALTILLIIIAYALRKKYFEAILGHLVDNYDKSAEVVADYSVRLNEIVTNSDVFYNIESIEELHELIAGENNNILLHGSAILALLKKDINDSIAHAHLKHMFDSESEEEVCVAIEVSTVAAIKDLHQILEHYIIHENTNIVRSVVFSILEQDEEFRLQLNKSFLVAAARLSLYDQGIIKEHFLKFGSNFIKSLSDVACDSTLSYNSRFMTLNILYELNPAHFRSIFVSIINKELSNIDRYRRCYNIVLNEQYTQLLKKFMDEIIVFVIKVIGLNGEIKSENILADTVLSKNPKTYGIGIEILEKITPYEIYGRLLPIIYKSHHKSILEHGMRYTYKDFIKDVKSSKDFVDIQFKLELDKLC